MANKNPSVDKATLARIAFQLHVIDLKDLSAAEKTIFYILEEHKLMYRVSDGEHTIIQVTDACRKLLHSYRKTKALANRAKS